jgi:hypothetical protein
VPVVLGLILILFAGSVSNRLLRDMEGVEPAPLERAFLFSGLAVLGVYFVGAGLFDVIYYLSRSWLWSKLYVQHFGPEEPVQLSRIEIGGLVSSAATLGAGIWLVLCADRVARRLLYRPRLRPDG